MQSSDADLVLNVDGSSFLQQVGHTVGRTRATHTHTHHKETGWASAQAPHSLGGSVQQRALRTTKLVVHIKQGVGQQLA